MLAKESLTEFFEKTRREAIKISFEKASEKLPVGASKFGGRPDLPSGFEWPYYGGKLRGEEFSYPLTFLMQINLEEVAPYDVEKRLPSRRFLYFFFERVEGVNINVDLEDEQGERGRVFYFDCSPSDLIETESPPHDGLERDFTDWDFDLEFAITFGKTFSVPCFDSCVNRIVGANELQTEKNEAFERFLADSVAKKTREPDFDDFCRDEKSNVEAEPGVADGAANFTEKDLDDAIYYWNIKIYDELAVDWEERENGESETRFFGYSKVLGDEEGEDEEGRPVTDLFLQLGTITSVDDEGEETWLGWGEGTELAFYLSDENLRNANCDRVFVWGIFSD